MKFKGCGFGRIGNRRSLRRSHPIWVAALVTLGAVSASVADEQVRPSRATYECQELSEPGNRLEIQVVPRIGTDHLKVKTLGGVIEVREHRDLERRLSRGDDGILYARTREEPGKPNVYRLSESMIEGEREGTVELDLCQAERIEDCEVLHVSLWCARRHFF